MSGRFSSCLKWLTFERWPFVVIPTAVDFEFGQRSGSRRLGELFEGSAERGREVVVSLAGNNHLHRIFAEVEIGCLNHRHRPDRLFIGIDFTQRFSIDDQLNRRCAVWFSCDRGW